MLLRVLKYGAMPQAAQWILHATEAQFRTGWFQESVISAAVIVLVIRTRRSFFQSLPGRYLLMATSAKLILMMAGNN